MKSTIRYIWKTDPQIEIERIFDTYVTVNDGFFQHFNFLLLPYPHKKHVYLPYIDFTHIPELPELHHDIPYDYSDGKIKKAERYIATQLKSYPKPKVVQISDIKAEFDVIKKEFTKTMLDVFPNFYRSVVDITFKVTPYGINCSFWVEEKEDGRHLTIWLRNSGMSMQEIMASLIHGIISCPVYYLGQVGDTNNFHEWKQREWAIDFLCKHSALAKFYPDTTIDELEKEDKKFELMQESDAYYAKLGAKLDLNTVKFDQKDFYINDTKIHLNVKEYIIMKLLYDNLNTIVSFDDIEDTLYQEDEVEYPRWAISKILERVRNKIKDTGIVVPMIYTFRNQGYMMKAYKTS
jgi:hypothetical protein